MNGSPQGDGACIHANQNLLHERLLKGEKHQGNIDAKKYLQ
jgi:hypothetical protein